MLSFRSRRSTLAVFSDVGPRESVPVLMVHGVASSPSIFASASRALVGYRVITMDLLGFGRSVAPAGSTFTIEEHERALGMAIDRLNLNGPLILVGHSLGALVVARYASTHPDDVAGVVLVSPPIYVPAAMIPSGVQRVAMELYVRSYDFLRANKRFTMTIAGILARALRDPGTIALNEGNWTAFERSLRNAIESQTTVVDIASTVVPVHILYGAMDPFVVPEVIRLVGALRHVNVRRIPLATHLIGHDLAAAIVDAVQSLSPDAVTNVRR